MPWHTVRIRSDLHRILQTQAAMQSRSTAGQLDFVLSRALEQETNTSASSGGGGSRALPGESERGEGVGRRVDPSSSPVRASDERADGEAGAGTVSHRPSPSSVPGQTTVDEMLASCPQCAGEMQDYCLDDGKGGGEMATRCEDCGFVREPEGT